MSIWNLRGTASQNALVQQALALCDFPWDELRTSLAREGRSSIAVEWADLSRFNHGAEGHEHADGAHTIVREVDGRKRVLGLFYLPPHTKVVLDNGLASRPALAHEVFLAEAAHACDYHSFIDRGLRPKIWNALHADEHHVEHVPESGDINHGHSWFDGPAGYSTWVGETVMALVTRAFAPSVQVTINLSHPITGEAIQVLREAYFPPVAPELEPTPSKPVYRARKHSNVVHDSHLLLAPIQWWPSLAAAQAAGMRACKVCRPT